MPFKFGGFPKWVRWNSEKRGWESGERDDSTTRTVFGKDELGARDPYVAVDEIAAPTNLEAEMAKELDPDDEVLLAMAAEDAPYHRAASQAEDVSDDTGETLYDRQQEEAARIAQIQTRLRTSAAMHEHVGPREEIITKKDEGEREYNIAERIWRRWLKRGDNQKKRGRTNPR